MLCAAIFDMDGLMVDTERLHHESFSAVLEQYGVRPVPNKQGIIHISGVSAETNWNYFKRQYGFEADNEELSKRKSEIHVAWLRKDVVAMPGLLPLLRTLHAHKIKISVASSSIREHIAIVIDKLRVAHYFDAIVSGEDVACGKPAPDIFLRAADQLGITPDECVVFEDASNGARAAAAAGMHVIAVPNVFTANEDFSVADKVIGSLEEVTMKVLNDL